MAMTPDASVCVIVAAYQAAGTIGRAVASALAEPEVAQVVVVDDASRDGTAMAARAADDGSGRLLVIVQPANAGPSAARNVAIAASRAPFLAVLDADDHVLPGRFAAMLAEPDWDFVADNIVFIDEGAAMPDPATIAAHRIAPRILPAATFVDGCLTRRGRYRGELGFLKPVMSRAFLDAHALRYAEDMRLSEDFDLYVRALMAGARFRLAANCGYVAVERPGSLSGAHGPRDLAAAAAATERALRASEPGSDLRHALARLHAQVTRKHRHRAALARRQEVGPLRMLAEQARRPAHLAGVLLDTAADKLGGLSARLRPPPPRPALRFLL